MPNRARNRGGLAFNNVTYVEDKSGFCHTRSEVTCSGVRLKCTIHSYMSGLLRCNTDIVDNGDGRRTTTDMFDFLRVEFYDMYILFNNYQLVGVF